MSDEKETDAPLPPITELHCAVCQFSTTDAKKYLDHIEHAHSIKPKREEAPAVPAFDDMLRAALPPSRFERLVFALIATRGVTLYPGMGGDIVDTAHRIDTLMKRREK